MIRLLLTLWLLAGAAAGQTIAWDPSPPSEGVNRYLVYAGSQSRAYTTNWTVTNATFVLPTNSAWRYVAVTALATNGLESAWSAELVLGPAPPLALRASYATNLTLEVRAGFLVSVPTTNWTTIAVVTVTNATAPRTYFAAQPLLPKAKAAPAPPKP